MKVIQSSVVRALVAIVVGVMLILYRKATLEWMVIITGALFFLSGCLSCLAYYWGRRKAIRAAQVIDEEGRVVGPHTPPLPIAGVGSVLLGLILMMMTGSFIRGVAYVLAAILILIPYVTLTGGVTLGTLTTRGWANLLIVGLFHTGMTYCLYFSALTKLPGQKAAILSYIDPLVAVVVSVVVLGEPLTLWQVAGGVLILGFTLWNEAAPASRSQST